MVNVEPETGVADAAASDHGAAPADAAAPDHAAAPSAEALSAGTLASPAQTAGAPVEGAQEEVKNRLTHRALSDALKAKEIGYEAAKIDATEEAHAQFRTLAATVPALVKGGGSTLDVEHGVVRHFIMVLFDYHKIGIGEQLDDYDALQAYYNLLQAYRARYVGHYDEQTWLEQLETRLRNALVKQLDDPESPTTVRVSNYTIEQLDGMIGLGRALRWEQAAPGAEACVLSKLKENMQKIFLELFPLENAMHDEPRAAIIKILKEIGERRGIPLPLEALQAYINEEALTLRTAINALEAQVEEEKFYTAKNRATRGGVKFFNFKKLKLQLALFPEIKVQSDGDEQTMEAFVDEMQRKVSEFSQRNFEHLLGKRLAQLQTAIEAICIEGRDEAIALEQAAKAFYDLDDIHFDEESEERSLKHKQSAERLKQLIDEILTPKIVEHLTATIGKSPQEVRQIMLWQVEDLMVLHNNLFAYIDRYVT